MSELDLKPIKERVEAATPGPWVREWAFSTHFVVPAAAERVADGNVARLKPHQRADAEFIAGARQDVPALIAEVDRLRANEAKLLAAKGTSWADGYETGCGMSHSLGCDAVAAQRDALVEEVEQLRAALLEEQTVHAKTFDNFEAFAETSLEQQQGLQAALARVEREYRQCIVAARVTHDSVHYATCNGRAEAYRQLADEVAAAAGLQAPDWDRIRREVPSDGIYRDAVLDATGQRPLPDACREMPPSTVPSDCPAHGVHPHNGMTCLDCPACWGLRAESAAVISGG